MWINFTQFMVGIAIASLIIFGVLFIVTTKEEEDWASDRNFYF